jgi:hypothetical protein
MSKDIEDQTQIILTALQMAFLPLILNGKSHLSTAQRRR